MRQGHAGATTLSKDAFAGDIIILGLAAKVLGGNLLELLPCVHGYCMRSARHSMGRLAATGRASPWQVLPCVAPSNFALLPWHAKEFGDHAMHVGPRLRSQITDAGLNIDLAIGLDDE